LLLPFFISSLFHDKSFAGNLLYVHFPGVQLYKIMLSNFFIEKKENMQEKEFNVLYEECVQKRIDKKQENHRNSPSNVHMNL
jgi:hypothetical protein